MKQKTVYFFGSFFAYLLGALLTSFILRFFTHILAAPYWLYPILLAICLIIILPYATWNMMETNLRRGNSAS